MTPEETEFLEAACGLARQLPDHALYQLCDALEALPAAPSSAKVTQVLTKVLVDKDARERANDTLKLWQKSAPFLSPQTFAWMLRSAASADSWREQQEQIEAVWTGPSTPHCSLRRSDAALIEVIDAAQERLWIVTFAAYRVQPVMSALKCAVERGVRVMFVGESSTESEALTSGGVSTLRAHLPAAVEFYIWPHEKRAPDAHGKVGTLHAKFAVADGSISLISSANLSGHALQLNIEAGVLVRGGNVPVELETQLINMRANGTLKPLP